MDSFGNYFINSKLACASQGIVNKNGNQSGNCNTSRYFVKKEVKNINNSNLGTSQKCMDFGHVANAKVNLPCKVVLSQKSIHVQQQTSQQIKKKLERPFKQKRFIEWFDRPKKPFIPKALKEQKQLENCKNVKECENLNGLHQRKIVQQQNEKQAKFSIANSSQKQKFRNVKGSPNQKKNVISFSPKHETVQANFKDTQKLNVVENKRKQLLKDLNSHKENREKKTIFKTPMFLLDKTPILLNSPKQAKKIMNSSSSIPKDFKTVENVCYPQDFGINQYIEQKKTKKTGLQINKGMSSQKTIRSYSYIQRKDGSSFPRIFKSGKQLSLQIVTNSDQKRFVSLKVLKILADNDASSTYLVVEKKTGFIYCQKKTEINLNNAERDTKIEGQSIQPQKQNMIRESKIGMILDHSFLIKTYSTLFDERNIYQLMQFASGSSLHHHNKKQRDRMKNKDNIEGQQSLHSILHIREILTQLLEGVCYLHGKGITHRDLKPANIFLSNEHIFKIGDFGCSIYQSPKDYVGTLDYAAPQIMLHHKHGLPVDMWAIGCIAFQLFVGQPPFYHPSRDQTIERIVECLFNISKVKNELLKDFIVHLLNKDPSKRMSSLQALNHPFIKSVKVSKTCV